MNMYDELDNRNFFCYQCGGGMYRRNHRWKCYDTFRKNGLSGVRVHTSTHGHHLQTKDDNGRWETIIRVEDPDDVDGTRKIVNKIDEMIEERS